MNVANGNSETTDRPRFTSTGLVVLGMHRSGTSAMSGALGLCGAWLGGEAELTLANFENPRGFWERRDIRAICDRLLHAAGADWWKVAAFEETAVPHSVIAEQGRAFRQVVIDLEAHDVWAVKEPRLCLLFQILRPYIPNAVCIHVHRNPLDVARSLRARNGFGVAEGLALWEIYNLNALQASAGLPRLVVSYEALVSQPEETLRTLIRNLGSFGVANLAVPATGVLEEFITDSLRHQRSSTEETVDFLLPSQRELWSRLQSGDVPPIESLSELSAVAYQHLRDLESRRGSADELAAKAKKSNAEARKAKAALQEKESRIGSLEAKLTESRTLAGHLTSQVKAQKTRVKKLETTLAQRTTEAQAAAETMRSEKERADRLKAELEANAALIHKLRDAVTSQAKERDQLATKAEASEARLSAIYSSHSWRVTAPLRTISLGAKRTLLYVRGAFRVLWWLATGQFRRVADAAIPRYQRYMPSRLKTLVPRRMARAVKRRMGAKMASQPSSTQHRSAEESGDVVASDPTFTPDTLFSQKVARSRFGQEIQLILERKSSPGFINALRRSESQLKETLPRLQSLTDRPLVSIVMPTHNRSTIIGGAITTVLEQEYTNWELLVCDDESTDDTEAAIARFFDSRIKYLKLPKQGAAAARNAGLQNATGDIIAYLDSDNFWHPSFLSAVVLALLENSGHSSVYADFIDVRVDKYGRRKSAVVKQAPFDHERLLKKPYIDLNSFAHRRELCDCFGGFDNRLRRRQDYDLILKYTWLRDPLHIPYLTTLYQRNDGLTQITRSERDDQSCISIINRSIADYFSNGMPVERPAVEKVTIVSWDMCRNHFSKPFALAEALSTHYDVQLISFRFFDEEIFPPLQGVTPNFETLYFPGNRFPEFFESMQRALAAIRGDIIYVVKPRLPSLGLALLANCKRGIPIVLEINDLETVVSAPKESSSHTEASFDATDLNAPELLNPYSDLWSQLMHPLARDMPVVVTHNSAIDREFGKRCLYMRNLKDEQVYDPILYDRDKVRTDLGFTPEDRVILFGGLIRKHKGIYELVKLIDHLDDSRYKLLFAGSRYTPDQKKLQERYGDRICILPPQNREAMARINLAADLVVLWLDPGVRASHYQMPYKVTDAFAMGPAVIANDISDFGLLAKQGYLHLAPFGDWASVQQVIQNVFANPSETAARRDSTRRLFLRQFSYAAGRSNFALATNRALAHGSGRIPAAEAFTRRFNDLYREIVGSDRDLIEIEEGERRHSVCTTTEVVGEANSEEGKFIVTVDVKDLAHISHNDETGVAVVMPSINRKKARQTAHTLVKRAGMRTTVFVVEDTLRQGFVRTLNDTAQRLQVAYLVYVAEDALPGVDWLRIAYEVLEQTGKGLLAFNDGKWGGRIAGFGMVRVQWAKSLYGGPILFPGYRAHKADNELTLVARIMNDFVYEPTATLVELDASKALEGGEGADEKTQTSDRNLFYERFHGTFDSRFRWRDVAPYKDEYLNLRKVRAQRRENYEPTEDAIHCVDLESIRSIAWHDPEGIAVIMPCVNLERARATARLLVQRAGIAARVYIVEDTLRRGFINALNDAAAQLDVKYIVYVAEDAFPGQNWLSTAHATMEEGGKGLLAFNCGKWHGRVAAFGMVRKDWVQQVYGGGIILHPAYRAHKADNELTVIARVTHQFVYEPASVLIENDPDKVFKESVPEDKATFHRRFRAGFDGLVTMDHLRPLAKSYFVSLELESAPEPGTTVSVAPGARTGVRGCENAAASTGLLLRSFAGPSGAERKFVPASSGTTNATMTSLRADILQKEKDRTEDPELLTVLDTLKTFAAKAIQRSPYSVTDKTTLPPSGDCRDYWHPAPYWWPDPNAPGGLPYVRKDGERVPGTRMYDPDSGRYDRTRLQRVFDDSMILGLAWSFLGERHYAEAGARILERFFIDPCTAMKPHLEYAQVRMGHNNNKGAPAGLIEAKDMYFYLDAVRLFEEAGALSAEVSDAFRNWLRRYLHWILSSAQGKAECAAPNNHGTCYDLQVGAIASFLGENDVVYDTLARAQERISTQFSSDGRQPEEITRTVTAHYCCFNLQSWINLAELSSRWGVNLWEYESPAGAGLKNAVRWLISHMGRPWPYEQIEAFDTDRFLPICFAASEHTNIGTGNVPPSIYTIKPVFFPHDGIRPFWNLASYGAASLSSRRIQATGARRQRSHGASSFSGARQNSGSDPE